MTTLDVPTIRASAGNVLSRDTLDAIDSDAIARFLMNRRWFGAKGARPTAAKFVELIPLPWDGGRMAIATVEVQLGEERRQRYQLPLSHMPAGAGRGGAVLAQVDESAGGGAIVDAVEDPRFLEGLAEALTHAAAFEGVRARWIVEPLDDTRALGLTRATPRVGSAEQSNTSIIFGDSAILKLFRKLDVGENPDVEIGRFLTTRTSFRGTPALLGTIRLEGEGGSSVAGILQRFVGGSGDAWKYALSAAKAQFSASDVTEGVTAFVGEARELGRVTRQMHDALASHSADPDFAPEPATRKDVANWAAAARRSIADGLQLLEERLEQKALPGDAASAAKVLVRRRAEFPALVDEVEEIAVEDPGMRIRHHGDYHLGQVLRTADGKFMIIDFEGEPARPLSERRARQSPLRDVAGMLRSFAYAAATAATEVPASVPRSTVEAHAGRWQRDVRKAFLAGYLADQDRSAARILPAQRAAVASLTSLFEIEKVFYELRYELDNRPGWAWIPLRGIARLTEAGAPSAE